MHNLDVGYNAQHLVVSEGLDQILELTATQSMRFTNDLLSLSCGRHVLPVPSRKQMQQDGEERRNWVIVIQQSSRKVFCIEIICYSSFFATMHERTENHDSIQSKGKDSIKFYGLWLDRKRNCSLLRTIQEQERILKCMNHFTYQSFPANFFLHSS